MKVLHVEAGQHLYGGARQVLYLLEGLQARGIESVLLCPRGSAIAQAARAFATIEETRSWGDIDLPLIARVRAVVARESIDLVHVHSRRGADVFAGLGARLAGVPAIVSRRVDNPERWLSLRFKYPLYERVIAISDGIRDVLLRQGISHERVLTVRSAIDAGAFLRKVDRDRFRTAQQLPRDSIVFAIVAQLIGRKGHRVLLDALGNGLLRDFPNVYFFLYGQGPLERELRQRIGHPDFVGRVRLMGFVSDLENHLPALDGLVHPADMEGLGVSLLQASAAGLPVIATAVGGIPEAVLDGQTGILVPPQSPRDLSEAIRRVIESPAVRVQMGEAGRQHVLRNFSIDSMVSGNLAVYRSVLC